MAARAQDKKEKDLFEDLQISDKKIRKKVRLHLPRLKNRLSLSYENIIFLAIGFVMCSIIFFSLGVEKGRQDANHIKRARIKEKKIDRPVARKKEPEVKLQDSYTIQLAAFKEKRSAEEELSKLERDGYGAGIKKSGGYYQVYIGGFIKEKEAERALRNLQKRYKDCYVKKL